MADTKLTMLIDLGTKMFNSNLEKLKSKWDQTVDKMKVKYNSLIEKLPAGMGKAVDKIKNSYYHSFCRNGCCSRNYAYWCRKTG